MLGTCAWRVHEGLWDPPNTSVGYTIDLSVGHSVHPLDMVSVRWALGLAHRALVKDVTSVRFLTSSCPSVLVHSFKGCRPMLSIFTTTDEVCIFICSFVLNGREIDFWMDEIPLLAAPYFVTHRSRWRVMEYVGIFLSLMLFALCNKWREKRSFSLVKWHVAVLGWSRWNAALLHSLCIFIL